jgi:hypothetical protein
MDLEANELKQGAKVISGDSMTESRLADHIPLRRFILAYHPRRRVNLYNDYLLLSIAMFAFSSVTFCSPKTLTFQMPRFPLYENENRVTNCGKLH